MKAYRPTQPNSQGPPHQSQMAGTQHPHQHPHQHQLQHQHQHPHIMPYPHHPAMAGPYGHPPYYAAPPGMYAVPPPPPGPMPPLVPTTKPVGEDKKADDAAPAGSTTFTTKEVKVKEEDKDKASAAGSGEDGDENKDDEKTGGLDLLASLAFPKDKKPKQEGETPAAATATATASSSEDAKKEEDDGGMPPLTGPFDPSNPNAAAIAILQKESKNKKKKSRLEEMSPKEKLFVDKVRESDVLCGRGGKSNHHPGNKRYRQVVSEMKRTYQGTGAKTAKTDLSRAIVEHVVSYGGRFIKRDEATGQYFLLTKAQARRKTSQALRETKELKWTM